MKIIDTSSKLPALKKGNNQKINKKKLSHLAERVKKILEKEGKFEPEGDEDISPSRDALSY